MDTSSPTSRMNPCDTEGALGSIAAMQLEREGDEEVAMEKDAIGMLGSRGYDTAEGIINLIDGWMAKMKAEREKSSSVVGEWRKRDEIPEPERCRARDFVTCKMISVSTMQHHLQMQAAALAPQQNEADWAMRWQRREIDRVALWQQTERLQASKWIRVETGNVEREKRRKLRQVDLDKQWEKLTVDFDKLEKNLKKERRVEMDSVPEIRCRAAKDGDCMCCDQIGPTM